MTKVVGVILAKTSAEADRQARAALEGGADLAEVRFDRLRDLGPADVRKLGRSLGRRAIATLRSPEEGGGRPRSSMDRPSFLREACQQGFAYVDLELKADSRPLSALRALARQRRSRVIVSCHLDAFLGSAKVREVLDACADAGDVAKVAVPIARASEAREFVHLAQTYAGAGKRFVLIGTGPSGSITRVLAEDLGLAFQYAAIEPEAASGQLPLRIARRLRGRAPFVLGILGHPIGHSASPQVHEAALEASNLPGVYLPFDVEASDLEPLLDSADRLRLRGLNVTIPHKEAIAPLLDELDGDAERVGAVNTIVLERGWSKGFNTDVYGFRVSLRSLGLRLGERRALVVGAGGAAKAVVHVLLREGARVMLTNRSLARADRLADSFDGPVEVVGLDEASRCGPWDLLVNATPAGMRGHEPSLPIPEAAIAGAGFVYDLVYNPPETPLLAIAGRLGKPRASGLEMLLHQAARSFELWTAREPPVEAMRRAAKEALR